MNPYFAAAGVLTFIIGLVHSVQGERLVFRRMRLQGFIPTNGGHVLREPHVRILWASWHIVTIFGWGIAAGLLWLAGPSSGPIVQSVVGWAMAIALALSALLVLVGTKGRHLGWFGLLLAAVLTIAGLST